MNAWASSSRRSIYAPRYRASGWRRRTSNDGSGTRGRPITGGGSIGGSMVLKKEIKMGEMYQFLYFVLTFSALTIIPGTYDTVFVGWRWGRSVDRGRPRGRPIFWDFLTFLDRSCRWPVFTVAVPGYRVQYSTSHPQSIEKIKDQGFL